MNSDYKRVLALDPMTRGCAFAILEGPERLVDWGVTGGDYHDDRRFLRFIEKLVDDYVPDVLALEDWTAPSCRRRPRARRLLRSISRIGLDRRLGTRMFSADYVRSVFSDEAPATKYSIAGTLAARFPELALRLPPPRRLWMSEDSRMGIFDAVAFGIVFYRLRVQHHSRRTRLSS